MPTPTDPMMQRTAPTGLSLFDHLGVVPELRTTSQIAAVAAGDSMPSRRRRILELLKSDGPQTLFELAAKIGCHAHQISGRLTDLRSEGLIELAGDRRPNPQTGCPAEVYRLRN